MTMPHNLQLLLENIWQSQYDEEKNTLTIKMLSLLGIHWRSDKLICKSIGNVIDNKYYHLSM